MDKKRIKVDLKKKNRRKNKRKTNDRVIVNIKYPIELN